jgi:hypothetical protein
VNRWGQRQQFPAIPDPLSGAREDVLGPLSDIRRYPIFPVSSFLPIKFKNLVNFELTAHDFKRTSLAILLHHERDAVEPALLQSLIASESRINDYPARLK